jgi:hypothetical protein
MTRRLLVTAVVLAFPGRSALGQREHYAPLVLQLPVSARSLAVGGGTVALREAESALTNPALLGGQSTTSLTLARYSSDAWSGILATNGTVGTFGFGFGVQYLDSFGPGPGLPPTSHALSAGGTAASSSLAATIGGALNFKGFRWGAAAKYAEARTGAERAAVTALDLGVNRDATAGNWAAGLVVQNLGPNLSIGDTRAQLPLRVALGVARGGYALGPWIDAAGTANVAVLRGGFVSPSAGGELSWVPIEGIAIAARAGIRRPELQELRPITGGAGFTYDRLVVDYAWESMRGGRGAHRLTVRVR